MKSEREEFGLLMSFDDQSKSFVHGYECGQLWEIMSRKEPIDRMVHSANKAQIKQMADVLLYRVDIADSEDPVYMRLIGVPKQPEDIAQ